MRNFFPNELPPYEPEPAMERAVKIALYRFAKCHTPACADRREWQRECAGEAWFAALHHAPHYRAPNPLPADPERHYVLWLSGKVLKHLRAYWKREKKHYNRCVPMVVQDEEGEEVELEFADEKALMQVEAVLEKVWLEQSMEKLSPQLDEHDWVIIEGMAAGRKQSQIAEELGISQSAVSQRWSRICAMVRQIGKESG